MAMTEEEKKNRILKRFKSAHPSGEYPSSVTEIKADRVLSKASPFMTLHGDREDIKFSSKEKMSPTALESAPLDLTRPSEESKNRDLNAPFSFDKLSNIAKQAVKSGDAEKMANVPLNTDQKKKVLSTLKSETKTAKAIENSETPKKASVSDNFTSALMQFLPLAAGSLIGGLDVGIAAQEGANAAVAAEQATAMDKEKLGIERMKEEADAKFKQDSIALQKQKLAQESYLAKLEMAQKIQDAGIKSAEEAQKRFVGSNAFGNFTALTESEAPKLREEVSDSEEITRTLNNLYEASENVSSLDRERKALIDQDIRLMVGKLKNQVVGTGPLSEEERKFVLETIGDPTSWTSLESVERLKLKNLSNTVGTRIRSRLRNTTVEGMAQMKAEQELKRRGYSQEQINKALGL